MKVDRKIAEQIAGQISVCMDKLNESLYLAQEELSEEDYTEFKRGVARAMNVIDMQILEKITEQHPDLRPWDAD